MVLVRPQLRKIGATTPWETPCQFENSEIQIADWLCLSVLPSPVMVGSSFWGLWVRAFCLPILTVSPCALTSCVPSAQLVLKGPIADQCTSAGLKGCDEISEGALLYADGKPIEGEQKLARGLRANAKKAAELKKFADALELVGKVPGASQYVAPLQPAVRLIQQVAAEDAKLAAKLEAENENPQPNEKNLEPASKTSSAKIGAKLIDVPAVTRSDLEALPTPVKPPSSNYYMVAGNGLAEQCRFVGTPKMLCMNEFVESTRVISDIIVSSGCTSDVVVTGRMGIEPEWAVYVPTGRGADVHGASLPLRPGRTLTVGVAYKSEDPTPDMRCGVTIVWQPLDIEGEVQAKPTHAATVVQLVEALRGKVTAGTATEQDRRRLRALCRMLGDITCSN